MITLTLTVITTLAFKQGKGRTWEGRSKEAAGNARAMAAPFDDIPDEILSDILERAVIDDFSTLCTSGQYHDEPASLMRLTEVCQRFNMLLRTTKFLAWSYAIDALCLSSFLLRRPPSQLRTVALDFKSALYEPELLYDFYAPFLSMLLQPSQQSIKKVRFEGVQLRLKDCMGTTLGAMEHMIGTLSMCPMLEHLQLSVIWPGLTEEHIEYPDGIFMGGFFERLRCLDVLCESFSIKDFERRFPKLEELCVHGRLEGSETLVSETLTRFTWEQVEQYTCKVDSDGNPQKLLVRGAKLRVVEVRQHWLYNTGLSLALDCPLLKTLELGAEKAVRSGIYEPVKWGDVVISHAPTLHKVDVSDLHLETVESILRSIAGANCVTVHPKLKPDLAALSAKYPKVESFRTPVQND